MPKNSSTLSPRIPLANALARVSFLVLLALLVPSCSTYQNVTSYFNTYYNAGKIFDDAVAEVERTPQPARDTNYFAPIAVPPATAQKFDKVIEKCSKLIQFYPQSGWVEGAILLIGKSYLYQSEYESAFRKFKELHDNFPAGDSRFEAKLWTARGKYGAKAQDEALALAKELFPEARAEGKDDIMQEALMLEAQIYVDRKEYDQAAATYALAVEISGGGAKRAFSQYQLGICYEKLGEYAKAADAYLKVQDYGPGFALDFRAKLKHGTMLSQVGLHNESIAFLEDLIGEQLKPEEYALADLEIANAYWALGDSAEAFSLYDFVDTTYARTDASAKSYYRRGLILEEHYANFPRAQEFYSRARTENTQSEIAPLAQKKFDNFTAYFTISKTLRNYDSLLTRALLPDSVLAKMDSVARASDTTHPKPAQPVYNPDTTLADAGDAVKDSAGNAPDDGGTVPPPPVMAPQSQQAERAPAARSRLTAGAVDMKSRRAHLGDAVADAPSEERFGSKISPARADSLKKLRVAQKVTDPSKMPPDSLRSFIAKSRFELASLFFLQMGYPDSALYHYKRMLEENPKSSLAPKALYAMAEVYRTKGDSDMVSDLYKRILREHDQSEYAAQVERVLGMKPADIPEDATSRRYARAESLLVDGKAAQAVRAFKLIAKAPPSALTPKAIYSVGWIYENVLLDPDSAAEWYRTLVTDYPASDYALEAGPRLAVKDDPASVDKYLKIKRVEAVAKPAKPAFGRRSTPADRAKQPGEENERGLKPADEDSDPDEDEPDQDEPEPEDPDDGGNL